MKAFRKIYEATVVQLSNECHRVLRDADQVQDVLQEVYASFYERRMELPADLQVGGYLRKAVRYRTIRQVRDRMRRRQQELVLDPAPLVVLSEAAQAPDAQVGPWNPGCPGTEIALVSANQEQRLRQAVHTLPVKCREAFVMSHYEELSYKVISAKMGISVKTVEKHVSKALQVLRRELREGSCLEWAVLLVALGLA